MTEIRIPTQKRSIEKRNKIIEKGFKLMCEKGYYYTTTNDIAAYANVSTGIIYQYFNDKKEIFIEGVKKYADNISIPMLKELDKIDINNTKLEDIISILIDKLIESHTISKKAHGELIAMSHLDNDIGHIFVNYEFETTEKIVDILNKNNIKISHQDEKIHIIYGIVDKLCHEIVYHKHDKLDYSVMKEEVIKIISTMIKP